MEEDRKKLVGIITFAQNSTNAGTCFQAWALQKYISSLPDFKAELVNYGGGVQKYSNIAFANGYGPLSWVIRAILDWKSFRFSSFQRKHFVRFPKKAVNREGLSLIYDRYDQFVLGSDQIWNPVLTKMDKTFFLDFVKGKKKGAYAPSIGIEDWTKEQKEEIKKLLSDFSYIGVREKQAITVVQELTDKPVHLSLDPTLLLNREEWAKVARKPKEKGEYIFELCITKKPAVRIAAEKLSKMTRLPIIEYGGNRKRVPSAKKMPHPSADTWLGYLMNAKYVLTDSFHGCAFSINTNTPFYIILTTNSNRITSLLEMVGLEDRIVKNGDEVDITKQIDWESVNKKLEEARTECQNWLHNSLKG